MCIVQYCYAQVEVAKAVKPQLPWPVSIAHEFVLEMFFSEINSLRPLANLANHSAIACSGYIGTPLLSNINQTWSYSDSY